MSRTANHEEIEIKLKVRDISAIRNRLKTLRAREISPRTYESNTLYDTPRQSLRRRGQLIRIRIERPSPGLRRAHTQKNTAILTYKGPPASPLALPQSGRRENIRSHFKIKHEQEVAVGGADRMAGILRALGLHPVFRYEKFRTTYGLPGIRGLKIELDETPVGVYIELEGNTASIDRGARLLGYDRRDYLKETYGSLYLADCCRRRRKPADMLFPPTKKLR